MFQMYLGSVISSCSSTFSYFLYQANTELFLVALARAMDRFVTVQLRVSLQKETEPFPSSLVVHFTEAFKPISLSKGECNLSNLITT